MNRSFLADLLVGLGGACLIGAAAWIWLPAALVVAGAICIVVGMRLEHD